MTYEIATEDEKLVHRVFLDGCPHPDYATESIVRDGFRIVTAVCVRCGTHVTIRSERLKPTPGGIKMPAQEFNPITQFARLFPRHFLDMVSSRVVLRAIEGKGWEWKRLVRDGVYTYAAENGTRRVEGTPSRNEVEAVRNMAVKLARSPLYRLSQ